MLPIGGSPFRHPTGISKHINALGQLTWTSSLCIHCYKYSCNFCGYRSNLLYSNCYHCGMESMNDNLINLDTSCLDINLPTKIREGSKILMKKLCNNNYKDKLCSRWSVWNIIIRNQYLNLIDLDRDRITYKTNTYFNLKNLFVSNIINSKKMQHAEYQKINKIIIKLQRKFRYIKGYIFNIRINVLNCYSNLNDSVSFISINNMNLHGDDDYVSTIDFITIGFRNNVLLVKIMKELGKYHQLIISGKNIDQLYNNIIDKVIIPIQLMIDKLLIKSNEDLSETNLLNFEESFYTYYNKKSDLCKIVVIDEKTNNCRKCKSLIYDPHSYYKEIGTYPIRNERSKICSGCDNYFHIKCLHEYDHYKESYLCSSCAKRMKFIIDKCTCTCTTPCEKCRYYIQTYTNFEYDLDTNYYYLDWLV
tara:strand:- start:483 stop:1739 length:1257 start_codon:yes stop_codon:yes gene_type:complete